MPFKSGAFLAGAPVQPVILRYGEDRVSPAWESIEPLWHSILMLANPFHSVTARQVCVPSDQPEIKVSFTAPQAATTVTALTIASIE